MPGSRRAGRDADRADARADPADGGPDVEVGLGIQGDKSRSDYAAIGRAAEDAGFDVVCVYGDLGFHPPIYPLLEIARATERVRLGPCSLNPYTLHAVEIAGQTAAVDDASGGRAFLGLVAGAWLDRLGIEQKRPLTKLRETVEEVRRHLGGDGVLHYEPRADVPLLIGSWGERTLRWAGEVADEVKIGGSANPLLVPVMRERVGNDRVGIVLGAVTVVDEDGDAARARAREEVEMYIEVVGGLDPTVDGDPREQLERFVFAGTPEEVAAQAQAVLDAGAKRVDFGTPHGLTWQRGLELLGGEVLPRLRRAPG